MQGYEAEGALPLHKIIDRLHSRTVVPIDAE